MEEDKEEWECKIILIGDFKNVSILCLRFFMDTNIGVFLLNLKLNPNPKRINETIYCSRNSKDFKW
jgi:hypothetical protein